MTHLQDLILLKIFTHDLIVLFQGEKGASSWLTALPVEEHGFLLNKNEFSSTIIYVRTKP